MRAEKKFVDEQATEREVEREEFTIRIDLLNEIIRKKEKEEDSKISLVHCEKVRPFWGNLKLYRTKSYG